jgi:type VI protein secretion system component VasF
MPALIDISRKHPYNKIIKVLQCAAWIMSLGFEGYYIISLGGKKKSTVSY